MKLCAVVCEFNPFHNGHKFLLAKAREISGCDAVICIMSGNFVQRCEPAVIDKRVRAVHALKNGADAVVEIPTLYAAAGGEKFAEGAVNIAASIPSVTHLAFGCECGDVEILKAAAAERANESAEFKAALRAALKSGVSYAAAAAKAGMAAAGGDKGLTAAACDSAAKAGGADADGGGLKALAGGIKKPQNGENKCVMPDTVLKAPNNLLGMMYLTRLKSMKSGIIPIAVRRKESGYNDGIMTENYSGAAAIRAALQTDFGRPEEADGTNGILAAVKNNVPENVFCGLLDEIRNHAVNKEAFDALALCALLESDLALCPDAGETGLAERLRNAARNSASLEDALSAAKSKRHTYARLKRITLQAVLKITHYPAPGGACPPFRVLGVRADSKRILSELPAAAIVKNKDEERLPEIYREKYVEMRIMSDIDARANAVYAALTKRAAIENFRAPLIIQE